MFTILKNNRELFSLYIRSEFVQGEVLSGNTEVNDNDKDGTRVDDLIKAIKENGKLDGDDLQNLEDLNAELDKEREELYSVTKSKLKEAYTETLSKGFEVSSEESYKVLQLILSKVNFLSPLLPYKDYKETYNNNSFIVSYIDGNLKVHEKGKITTSNSISTIYNEYINNDLSNNSRDDNEFNINGIDKSVQSDMDTIGIVKSKDNENKNLQQTIISQNESIDLLTSQTNELPKLKLKVTELEKQVKGNIIEIERLNKEVDLLNNEIENLKLDIKGSDQSKKEMLSRLNALKDERNGLKDEISGLEDKLLKVTTELTYAKSGIEALKNSKGLDGEETELDGEETELGGEETELGGKQPVTDGDITNELNIITEITETPEQLIQKQILTNAINFNKKYFKKDGIKFIQVKLGFTGEDVDGFMGPKTFAKISKLPHGADGKIGRGVLRDLKLIDKNNKVTDKSLTEDLFKEGKLKNKIIFEKTISEKTKTLVDKTSNAISETYNEATEYITATSKQISTWVEEAFTNTEMLKSFKGGNGEEIEIDYDKDTNKLKVDTVFFDGVDDFDSIDVDFTKIPKDETERREYFKGLVNSQLTIIKDKYDKKALKNALGIVDTTNAKFIDGEAVLIEESKMTIAEFDNDAVINGLPKNKESDLIKFYKHSSLTNNDKVKVYNYTELKKEKTFTQKINNLDATNLVNVDKEVIYTNESGTDSYTVTRSKDGIYNIDSGALDFGGTNFEGIPNGELEKVISWYSNSGDKILNFNTVKYADIKDELYQL